MKKFICKSCNYIYEPGLEDVDGAVGVYESLPDDWVCPGCGADKSHLVEQEVEE